MIRQKSFEIGCFHIVFGSYTYWKLAGNDT